MRTTFILSIISTAIIAGIIFLNIPQSAQPLDGTPQEMSSATTSTASETTPASAKQAPKEIRGGEVGGTPEEIPAPAPNVTLSVDGHVYQAFAPAHSTVLDAMRALASTNDFTFTGHDYPSLGFFVDSINGRKTEKSYNWILYINGTLSNTGASQTTLKAGDAIEWRYEKNY